MVKCTKFYQAGTSEMFGGSLYDMKQDENTKFIPKSPYGCAKLYAHWITKIYRESYNMFTCCGILHNHSSIKRGENFILRKISSGISNIKKKKVDCLYFGNIDAKRDLGSTKDYREAMYLILQHNKPTDYVISTGKQYSIREIIGFGFKIIGINIKWKGDGLDEIGYDNKTGEIYVRIDEKFFRPCDIESTMGDSSKIWRELGWKAKVTMYELLEELINNDLNSCD